MSTEVGEIRHSKKNMASYGFGNFMNEFVGMAFGTYAFFFYEVELNLNVWLVGLGFFFYAIYNAIKRSSICSKLYSYIYTALFRSR